MVESEIEKFTDYTAAQRVKLAMKAFYCLFLIDDKIEKII